MSIDFKLSEHASLAFGKLRNNMVKRKKIGDLLEIPLMHGFAYAQYINEHKTPPKFGSLIRVFPETYEKRPENVTKILDLTESFFAFVPLARSITLGLINIVDHAKVPERCRSFPKLKRFFQFDLSKPKVWFVVEFDEIGNRKTTRYTTLPKKYHGLSMDQVITIPLLAERIEGGWTPESEV